MADRVVELDGHDVSLSSQDKVFFPNEGITKGDLVDYYLRICDVALPHYRERPLTMERYPDGIAADGFFQKNADDYFPDFVATETLDKSGGSVRHVIVNSAATLIYLANQAMITPHLGLSRIDDIDAPDRMIFDLDPGDDDFSKVQFAASELRNLLEAMEIRAFIQLTGSRGLHVVVPLDRSESFDAARDAARRIAEVLSRRHANALTMEQRKKKRGRRVFLDTGRNAYGQTAVAPYGVRALPGAPIATPLDWEEALSAEMSPQKYTIGNIFRRLGQRNDPWGEIDKAVNAASEVLASVERLSE